jgi:hypothetical protein
MMRPSCGHLLLAGAVTAVAAALIAGLVVVGPPSAERARRLDEVRVSDLVAIENLVSSFARVHKSLPQDLASLAEEPGYSIPRGDPESGKPYGYELVGTDAYRLCAHFATRSAHESMGIYPSGHTWFHSAGDQCFNRRLDPGIRN